MNNKIFDSQCCADPDRIEEKEMIDALFPDGAVPEGGVVPPPNTVCQHGMPPKPCPPRPPMAHELYRTITVKMLRLVLSLQKSIRDAEGDIDKIKDQINKGEVNITIDDFLSTVSKNPVQNKVITLAIEDLRNAIANIEGGIGGGSGSGGSCNCIIDEELSPTSTNAVRNLTIYKAIKRLEDMINSIVNSGGGGSGDEGGGSGGSSGGGSGGGSTNPNVSYMLVTAYIASDEKPSRPTGGGYDFTLGKATPPLGGWVLSVPQSGKVWMSYNTFRDDGTDSGWTDPVEFFDFVGILDNIDKELQKMYEQMLADARKDLNDALKSLDEALLEASEAQEQAKQQLADAQKMIQDARDLLASLDESTGTSGIEESLAKVNAFAEWYDVNAETITSLSATLDAINGTITQQGMHIDTIEETVTGVQTQLNAHDGTITNLATRLNTVEGTVSNVVTELDAANATITDQARLINTIDGTVNTVTTRLSAAEDNIKLNASRISTVNERLDSASVEINGAKASILSHTQSIDGLNNSVTQVSNELNAQKELWNAKVQKLENDIVSIGSLSVTPDMIIAAIAKDAEDGGSIGASIILAINNTGDTNAVIDADRIVLTGDVIAKAIKTGGLTIYNDSNMAMINLAKDGSGFVAGGRLSWTTKGVTSLGMWTVNETTITGGNLVLDSKGNIICKNGDSAFWSLNNNGSAEFGCGKLIIAANGNVYQAMNQYGASVNLQANGSGSIGYGLISWDTATMTIGAFKVTKNEFIYDQMTAIDSSGHGCYIGSKGLGVCYNGENFARIMPDDANVLSYYRSKDKIAIDIAKYGDADALRILSNAGTGCAIRSFGPVVMNIRNNEGFRVENPNNYTQYLSVNGSGVRVSGLSVNVTTVTSHYTASVTDDVIVFNTSSNVYLTLPAPDQAIGKVLYVKKIAGGHTYVRVSGGSSTIIPNNSGINDASSSRTIDDDAFMFVSNGAYWLEFRCA